MIADLSVNVNLHKLTEELFGLDQSISFVCFAKSEGKILSAKYRDNTTLSREESELSVMQALIRMNTRKTMQEETGRPLFSLTEYEKVIRATIMVYDFQNRSGADEVAIFLTIDKQAADPYMIVKDKIIPYIDGKFS